MVNKTQALIEQYAKSLVEIAIEKDCIFLIEEEVKAFITVFQSTDLNNSLQSLAISKEQKRELVRLFQESSSEYMSNFLEIILQNQRENLLFSILESILEKITIATNTHTVEVTTAVSLTETQKEQLLSIIQSKFHLTVGQLVEKIDPAILGGFIINVNNQIIDTSIRHQLQQLKMNLK